MKQALTLTTLMLTLSCVDQSDAPSSSTEPTYRLRTDMGDEPPLGGALSAEEPNEVGGSGAAPQEAGDTSGGGGSIEEDMGLIEEDMGSTAGAEADLGVMTDPNGCGEELCDGLDNDCDGVADEHLTRACPCDKSQRSVERCVEGAWSGCEDGMGRRVLSEQTTISLPALPTECPFDQGDNLSPDTSIFAARVEQVAQFELPSDAELCGFSLSGGNEQFYFDDELMLLINDVPLIGSVNFASQFELIEGLPRYDWLRIRGKTPDEVGAEVTCLAGATECQIPGTQSNGELRVSFDEVTNGRLVSTSDRGDYQFKVVVTGDNDPGRDCSHSGLTLQVRYDYLAE